MVAASGSSGGLGSGATASGGGGSMAAAAAGSGPTSRSIAGAGTAATSVPASSSLGLGGPNSGGGAGMGAAASSASASASAGAAAAASAMPLALALQHQHQHPYQQPPRPFEQKKICGFIFNFSNTVPGMLYRSRNDPGTIRGGGGGIGMVGSDGMGSPSSMQTSSAATMAAAKGGRSQQPASQAKQKPPRPRAEGKGSQGQDTKAEREAGAAEGSGSGSGGGGGAGGDGEGEGLGPAAPLWDLASGVDFGEEVDKPPEKLDLRQRMALTLRNWCIDEENMMVIAKEGAIQALAALAAREDRLTRRCCAAAFYFLSRNTQLRADLVHVGATAIIAQVALNTKSPRVALSCAASLCNLSLEPGVEARLAEEGAVGALCTLLLTFPQREVWSICLQALYNLTCVQESYNGIDRVLKGLLSSYDTPCQELDPSQILGLAVANMSVIYRMRLRLLEEGIINVVNTYILPHADGPMRHNVAVTLHNIACNRSCRSEMVNRGVLACLLSLSAPPPPPQAPPATDGGQAPEEDGRGGGGDGHQQHLKPPAPEQGHQGQQEQQAERARLLECVAVTLQCLSLNVGTRRRTIQEGAVRVVLNLLEQQPAAGGPRALQACAQALHAFSAFDDCAGPLLKHQAVPALVKLSGAAGALLAARESYVAAFCNLLSLEGNHAVVLDQHGCLGCVLGLLAGAADDDNVEQGGPQEQPVVPSEALLEYLSCLYSNLACGKPRRAAAVMAGLVPRLIYLCFAPGASIKIKTRCATALANLLAHGVEAARANAIAATATAFSPCGSGSSASGGEGPSASPSVLVSPLGLGARGGDGGSGGSGGDGSSNQLLRRMVEDGAIGCLARLLRDGDDEALLESVAVALALASFHPEAQAEMLKQGVVHALIQALRGERIQARATKHAASVIFAALSFTPGHIPHLFEAGALEAVFLLARTEETATRKRCATVLCNLSFDAHVRDRMVAVNAVRTLAQLSNTYSDETQMDCASCFCNLSCGSEANREAIVRQGAVGALLMIGLVRAVTTRTREVCARALVNLVTDATVRLVLEEGVAQGLASLCGLDSEDCLRVCAQAFWVLSRHAAGRAKLTSRRSIMQGLCSLIRSGSEETRKLCGATVYNLLLDPATAAPAAEAGALGVVKVMSTVADPGVTADCANAVAKISACGTCRERMAKESIPQAMVLLAQQSEDRRTAVAALRALCCLTLFQFSMPLLLEAGVIHVLIYRVLSGVFLDDVVGTCTRILYHFAQCKEMRPALTKAQVVCTAVVLLRRLGADSAGDGGGGGGTDGRAGEAAVLETMLASIIERLSWPPTSQHRIVEDGAMLALVELVRRRHDPQSALDVKLAKSAATTFGNLARVETYRLHLVSVGTIEAIALILERGLLDGKRSTLWRVVLGLQRLSESPDDLLVAMALNGAAELLVFIITAGVGSRMGAGEIIARYAVGALCNFSHCKECRPILAAQGAIDALMALSRSGNAAVQRYCSIALANISGQGKLQPGSVGALVRLFKAQDGRERLGVGGGVGGGAAAAGEGGDGEGVNKKAAVQAKFRRLLMAATLAKELNETASGGGGGGEGGVGGGMEGQAASTSSAEQPGDGGASSASTAAAAAAGGGKRADNGEEDGGEKDGEGDEEEEEEEQRRLDDERDKEAFYQATARAITDGAETAAAGMDMVWYGQQKPSLAAWDITPPPHETVFYKCNQIGPVLLSEEGEGGGTAATAASGGDQRASMAGGGGAGSVAAATEGEGTAMSRASVGAPRATTPTAPSTTFFSGAAAPAAASQPPPLDNVIVVRHPKLQACPPLRSRQLQQRSSGASTPAAAFLLERRKTSLLPSQGSTASAAAGGPKPAAGGEGGKTIAGAAGMLASRWKARKAASAAPSPPRARDAPPASPPSPPPSPTPPPSEATAAAPASTTDGTRKSLTSLATAPPQPLSSESAARRSLSSTTSTTSTAGPADITSAVSPVPTAQPEERGLVATQLPAPVPLASLAYAPSRTRPRPPTATAAADQQRVAGRLQQRRPLPALGPQQPYRIDPELLREAFSYGARPRGGGRGGQGQGRSASPPRRRGGGAEERARRRLVLK